MAQFLGFTEIISARRGFAAPFMRGSTGPGPIASPWYRMTASAVWSGLGEKPSWPSPGGLAVIDDIDYSQCSADYNDTVYDVTDTPADLKSDFVAAGYSANFSTPKVKDQNGDTVGYVLARWADTSFNMHPELTRFDQYGMWLGATPIGSALSGSDNIPDRHRWGSRFTTGQGYGGQSEPRDTNWSLNRNTGELVVQHMFAPWLAPGAMLGDFGLEGVSAVGAVADGDSRWRVELDHSEASHADGTSNNLISPNPLNEATPGSVYFPQAAILWADRLYGPNDVTSVDVIGAGDSGVDLVFRQWAINSTRVVVGTDLPSTYVEYFHSPASAVDPMAPEYRLARIDATDFSPNLEEPSLTKTNQELFRECLMAQTFGWYLTYTFRPSWSYMGLESAERQWWPDDGVGGGRGLSEMVWGRTRVLRSFA
jgi:hypothetical protein